MSFREIKTSDNSGYNTARNIQITELDSFNLVWSELFTRYARKPPVPVIDFEKNMLLAVTLGERNSGGYSIKINSITETKDSFIVIMEESKPGTTCMTTSVMTYPFQLIELPKTDKKMVFKRVVKIYECGK